MKVYTLDSIRETRLAAARKIVSAPVFEGTKQFNLSAATGATRFVESAKDSETLRFEMDQLRYKVTNAAQAPSNAEIEAFWGKFYIDVTRRANESPDLTSVIAAESVNFEFPETVNLRDLEKFRGVMKTVSGANDGVSLIEQNTGNVDTLTLTIKAVGWKDTIK